MRCWECKRPVVHTTRVIYLSNKEEKGRDICSECFPLLKFNPCHFIEVKSITHRQLYGVGAKADGK